MSWAGEQEDRLPPDTEQRPGRVAGFMQRRSGLCLAGILVATSIGFAANMKPYWKLSQDGLLYVGSAKNLAEGEGLQLFGTGNRAQPPLVSVYMAVGFLLPGSPAINVQLLQLAAVLAIVVLAYRLLRRLHHPVAALVVAALVGVNYELTRNATYYLSEPLFTVFMLAALLAGLDLFRDGRPAWRNVLLFGAMAAGAALTRKVGLVFFPAALCSCLFWKQARSASRKDRALVAAVVLLFATPYIAWTRYNAAQPILNTPLNIDSSRLNMELLFGDEDVSVGAFVRDLPHRLARGGRWQLEGLLRAMITPASGIKNTRDRLLWEGYLLCIPLAGAFVWGWWRHFRKEWGLLEFFVAAYVLVIFLHARKEGSRFLLPLLPVAWVYTLTVLAALVGRWKGRPTAAFVAAGALLIASAAVDVTRGLHSYPSFHPAHGACEDVERIAELLADRPDLLDARIRLWIPQEHPPITLCILTNRPLLNLAPAIPMREALDRSWREGVRLVVLDIQTNTPPGPPPADDRYKPVYQGRHLLVLERL
jgi:4-amino-4-deoxy-L-arabinose transferase-like glycosyltransferase